MINKLLWRCPVCKTNDAIVHRRRRFRPDLVNCTACGSVWELHRVRGGTDFRFRAVAGPLAGTERPLAEWYDMMREGLALTPLTVQPPPISLEPGESLYLHGRAESTLVMRMDPRFRPAIARLPTPELPPRANPEPGQKVASVPDRHPPGGDPRPDRPPLVDLGRADLFLTDRRLIVRLEGRPPGGDLQAEDPTTNLYSLPLETVRAVQLLIDRFLIIRHVQRLTEMFEFGAESPLKWRAYLDLALRPVAEAHNFQVHMAYD